MIVSRCTVDGCEAKTIMARGLCAKHYQRQRNQGSLSNLRSYIHARKCSVLGCKKEHAAFGFCGVHLGRYHAHGDPLKNLLEEKQSEIAEFVAKAKTYKRNSCLIWPYAKSRGRPIYQKRGLLSKLCLGKKPKGFTRIEHRCNGGLLCINPKHFRWAKFKPRTALTEDDVAAIKASDKTQVELAKEFGVTQSNISAVVRGKTWTSVKPKGRLS